VSWYHGRKVFTGELDHRIGVHSRAFLVADGPMCECGILPTLARRHALQSRFPVLPVGSLFVGVCGAEEN